MRLLVIDGEDTTCELLRRWFGDRNFIVESVSTIGEAEHYSCGSGDKPDAMVVDLELLNGSGLDFMRRLRLLGCQVPVAVITKRGSQETAIEALRLGAVDYAEKPLNHEELEGMLHRLVGHHRARTATNSKDRLDAFAEILQSRLEDANVATG